MPPEMTPTSLPLACVLILILSAIAFKTSPRFRFYVRMSIFLAIVAVSCFSGLVVVLLQKSILRASTRLQRNPNSYVSAVVRTLTRWALPIRFEVEGDIPSSASSCVIITNHQSELDMLAVACFTPSNTLVMAKEEVKYIPMLGQYLQLAGNILINRSNHKSAIETMAHVATVLHDRRMSLQLFPEGTRSYQTRNEMLPFKKGAFNLAVSGHLPIIPVVISSYHDTYNLQHSRFEGGVVKIKILRPVSTMDLTLSDVPRLTDECHTLMLKTLQEISSDPPSYAGPMSVKTRPKTD